MISPDQIKFRCSGLHHIMSEANSITAKQLEKIREFETREKPMTDNMKKEYAELISKRDKKELPTGVKTHLIDLYTSVVEHRRSDEFSNAIEKGNYREQDAINLVSLSRLKRYKKNHVRKTNDYITGECDIDDSPKETIDTKNSYERSTFNRLRFGDGAIDPAYEWQGHGYMWLFGSKKHTVATCCCNGLAKHLEQKKRMLGYIYEIGSPAWIDHMRQAEINQIFDLGKFLAENKEYELVNVVADWSFDIPWQKRIFTQSFEYNELYTNKIISRVKECKLWMQENLS